MGVMTTLEEDNTIEWKLENQELVEDKRDNGLNLEIRQKRKILRELVEDRLKAVIKLVESIKRTRRPPRILVDCKRKKYTSSVRNSLLLRCHCPRLTGRQPHGTRIFPRESSYVRRVLFEMSIETTSVLVAAYV
ncbi:hypothetical protein B6U74_03325 [Candidatus Bathyarchaeota archaeon ex4484_205]|nr:MAG: hypothetical protein B6U74_03325 [Candidatus Bathyarchaeota archaeon ex4484_205]